VRRIVEAHGGEITVESVVGQGSTFTVAIPVANALSPEPEIEARLGVGGWR
jgi:signal transduction histidine kinase